MHIEKKSVKCHEIGVQVYTVLYSHTLYYTAIHCTIHCTIQPYTAIDQAQPPDSSSRHLLTVKLPNFWPQLPAASNQPHYVHRHNYISLFIPLPALAFLLCSRKRALSGFLIRSWFPSCRPGGRYLVGICIRTKLPPGKHIRRHSFAFPDYSVGNTF